MNCHNLVRGKKEEKLYNDVKDLLKKLHTPLRNRLNLSTEEDLLVVFTEMWDLQKSMHILVKDILISLGKYIKQKNLKNVENLQFEIFTSEVI